MKMLNSLISKGGTIMLLLAISLGIQLKSTAQGGVTVYQYRRVPNDKIEEFLKRETTYWAIVAEKAMAGGNLTFWALLEKVGGYDLENSSNYLFVNTCKDIDKIGDVWNSAGTVFPNVPMDKMETNSMSTVTSMFFLEDRGWQQAANADPSKDFMYIAMVYHNTNYPDSLISLENKYWGPFIKSAMDKNQTTQRAWGNTRILSPSGDNIKATTVSYDLYPNLKEALIPTWNPSTVFPEKGLSEINNIELGRRGGAIYRIVKAVSAEGM
ncbi:MAG TPA: hypothetical protein VI583_13530 [Cyclobacteriaceae bacterium]|nr:hypothetical protein [Cyclobacteriaceae bacterium]